MIIQAEVHIRAPLPVVWRVFSHLEEWKDWNTACNSCRLVEGNELAAGACLANGAWYLFGTMTETASRPLTDFSMAPTSSKTSGMP